MNQPSNSLNYFSRLRGFTLMELLTVITVIGILAGIIIPTVHGVQIRARKVKTRAQFSQWANAMELFRAEYGYYPKIDGAGGKSGKAEPNQINTDKFAVALTGRHFNGEDSDLRASSAQSSVKCGNLQLITFYTIGEGEVGGTDAQPKLKDAFGNTEIAVLYDTNYDGIINATDISVLPPVKADAGGKYTPDANADFNFPIGIRAGVIFYSAGPGDPGDRAIDSTDAVFSWK
jgi:prepilin-type N-terminal cleavage/methylation domain-containing protein